MDRRHFLQLLPLGMTTGSMMLQGASDTALPSPVTNGDEEGLPGLAGQYPSGCQARGCAPDYEYTQHKIHSNIPTAHCRQRNLTFIELDGACNRPAFRWVRIIPNCRFKQGPHACCYLPHYHTPRSRSKSFIKLSI